MIMCVVQCEVSRDKQDFFTNHTKWSQIDFPHFVHPGKIRKPSCWCRKSQSHQHVTYRFPGLCSLEDTKTQAVGAENHR